VISLYCKAGTINPDGREGQEAVKMMYAKGLVYFQDYRFSSLCSSGFSPVSGMAQNGAEEAVKGLIGTWRT
jgi:hypothetical protein